MKREYLKIACRKEKVYRLVKRYNYVRGKILRTGLMNIAPSSVKIKTHLTSPRKEAETSRAGANAGVATELPLS
jgi:hypothetical protein